MDVKEFCRCLLLKASVLRTIQISCQEVNSYGDACDCRLPEREVLAPLLRKNLLPVLGPLECLPKNVAYRGKGKLRDDYAIEHFAIMGTRSELYRAFPQVLVSCLDEVMARRD